jgi:hypothetical protein
MPLTPVKPRPLDLRPASLDDSQLERLDELEREVACVVVAYQRE